MENGQKKLSDLFDGRKIFNIPHYQRAYAWSKGRQLPEFLEDIDNQTLGRDYFLGTILFQAQGKQNHFELIDVVDGQQRITTVIVFMKALLCELASRLDDAAYEADGLNMLEESYIRYNKTPKLRVISSDNEFFQSYILGDDEGYDYIETPSQRRLYEAKTFFSSKLRDRSTDELRDLKEKLDEYTKVLTYSVQDTGEATLIFETTNDRGKGLTNLEKIKSFLMYKAYLASGEGVSEDLENIQLRFSNIYRDLEALEGRIDEDALLQYHCIAFESWSEKPDYQQPVSFVKEEINGRLRKQDYRGALTFIDRFSRELRESVRTMRDVMNKPQEAFLRLVHLERMGGLYPLLIKAYKLDATEGKDNYDKVCKLLEIYVFRVFSVQLSRSQKGQSQLYRMARDFSGRFQVLFDKMGELVEGICSRKRFRDALVSPTLYEWMSSRDISYLLWSYENYLRRFERPVCSPMSLEELRGDGPRTRLTVEHIAPQTPNHRVIQSSSVLPDMDDMFIEKHLHRLGNLTFDPLSANSSKGNSDIEVKNSKYFAKAPYKTQNELESFLNAGKWSVDSIEAREKKIVNFCLKRWCVDYIDEPIWQS